MDLRGLFSKLAPRLRRAVTAVRTVRRHPIGSRARSCRETRQVVHRACGGVRERPRRARRGRRNARCRGWGPRAPGRSVPGMRAPGTAVRPPVIQGRRMCRGWSRFSNCGGRPTPDGPSCSPARGGNPDRTALSRDGARWQRPSPVRWLFRRSRRGGVPTTSILDSHCRTGWAGYRGCPPRAITARPAAGAGRVRWAGGGGTDGRERQVRRARRYGRRRRGGHGLRTRTDAGARTRAGHCVRNPLIPPAHSGGIHLD